MSNLTEMFKHWTDLIKDPTPRPVSIPKIVVIFPRSFKHGKLARRRGVAGKRIRGWTNPLSRRSYWAKSVSMESYGSGPFANPDIDLEIDFNINKE